MENIDKRREIPPSYNEHVFPEILDEFWKKVSAKKKKNAKMRVRRKKSYALWCCNIHFVKIFVIVQSFNK